MPTFFAPPLSFASRFRPCAGTPGLGATRGRTLALYVAVVAAHGLAVLAATASTRPARPLSESTLAVEWLVDAPARPSVTPQAAVPPTPVRARPINPPTTPTTPAPLPTPVAEAAAPAPSAPAVPTPAPSPAPSVAAAAPAAPAESRVAPPPVPIEAPRYDADYLHNPAPDYPSLSRRFGEEGKVVLRVEVSADGLARQVEVARSSGSPRLDAAALDAVRRWRFQPARQGAQALAGWVQVPINFRLNP